MQEKPGVVYVYDDFSFDDPVLLGRLYISVIKDRESYSFEYDTEWLKNTRFSVDLDPELPAFKGRHYPVSKKIFGMFEDASPDRWGRVLMNKRERIIAEKEGRKPKKLHDADYLLGVYDKTRMGGLRFKFDPDGSFVVDDAETPVPPWTMLRDLEEAVRHYERSASGLNEKWLEQLLKPGSSLGGARPKATVIDTKGQLWIAKFPSKHDETDAGAWEKVVHDLAGMCGLCVPESRLEKFSKNGSTFLVRRFDRDGQKRIHFASAMTLLGKTDGMAAQDGTGYLDIAAFIRANGANPKADLIELWKRILFNMAVSNTDDHLRNHAFVFSKKGWTLSPLYDVNPIPYGEELSLNVDETDNRISLELLLESALRYGIERDQAKHYAEDFMRIVRENWMKLAAKYGLSRSQTEEMRPAFRFCYIG